MFFFLVVVFLVSSFCLYLIFFYIVKCSPPFPPFESHCECALAFFNDSVSVDFFLPNLNPNPNIFGYIYFIVMCQSLFRALWTILYCHFHLCPNSFVEFHGQKNVMKMRDFFYWLDGSSIEWTAASGSLQVRRLLTTWCPPMSRVFWSGFINELGPEFSISFPLVFLHLKMVFDSPISVNYVKNESLLFFNSFYAYRQTQSTSLH